MVVAAASVFFVVYLMWDSVSPFLRKPYIISYHFRVNIGHLSFSCSHHLLKLLVKCCLLDLLIHDFSLGYGLLVANWEFKVKNQSEDNFKEILLNLLINVFLNLTINFSSNTKYLSCVICSNCCINNVLKNWLEKT